MSAPKKKKSTVPAAESAPDAPVSDFQLGLDTAARFLDGWARKYPGQLPTTLAIVGLADSIRRLQKP